MKLKSIALIALLSLCFNGFSQSKKIENVKKISMNGVRAIKEKHIIKGYFTFFFLEKEDKKNNNYLLEVMDANLKTTQSIPITKTKTTYLLEGQFNGTHFCFTFLDTKLKVLTNDVYDQNGKKTGTYTLPELEPMTYQYLLAQVNNESGYYSGTLVPIESAGFAIIYTTKSAGGKYNMDMFDEKGTKKWTNTSGDKEKAYEAMNVLNSNNQFVVCNFSSRPSAMSTKVVQKVFLVDAKTGKKITDLNLDSPDEILVSHGVDFIIEDQEFVMFGEVFGSKKGTIDVKNKKGFFVNIYDSKGNLKKHKTCGWKEDIGKKININDKGKFADGISIMIHNVIKTKDGRYFAVGEQFNKEISAGGVAMKTLAAAAGGSSNVSAMKIALYNFMTFEFNKELELDKVEVVLVEKTNVLLPEGYGAVSEDKLGYILKAYGWFNYNFTTINEDRSNFSSTYTVYNRGSDNKDNRYSVGVITLNSDKKLVSTKLDLKSKPTAFVALPTKPGYVAIFEYFRKEKYAEIRLEKLDL